MPLHQEPFELLDGLAHCIRLPQDIHTILVLFDHPANPTQVPLNVIESLENLLFISLHLHTPFFFPYPLGRGIDVMYHSRTTSASGESKIFCHYRSRFRLTFRLFSFIVIYIVLSKRLEKTIDKTMTRGK